VLSLSVSTDALRWGSRVVGGSGARTLWWRITFEGDIARALCAGSWLRLGCSRLADNQIGAVGVEALARALPPGLTMLGLSGTCGLGASVL
jgi:hypothetical protein